MNLIHENKPVSLRTFTYELNPARVKQRWVVHGLNQEDTAYSNPTCFISNESPQILYPLKSTQLQNTVILIYSSLHAMFTQRIKGLSVGAEMNPRVEKRRMRLVSWRRERVCTALSESRLLLNELFLSFPHLKPQRSEQSLAIHVIMDSILLELHYSQRHSKKDSQAQDRSLKYCNVLFSSPPQTS